MFAILFCRHALEIHFFSALTKSWDSYHQGFFSKNACCSAAYLSHVLLDNVTKHNNSYYANIFQSVIHKLSFYTNWNFGSGKHLIKNRKNRIFVQLLHLIRILYPQCNHSLKIHIETISFFSHYKLFSVSSRLKNPLPWAMQTLMLLNLYQVLKGIKQVYHDNWCQELLLVHSNIIVEREGKIK